jgi:uncharacterized protein YodC (DUF2158 family)
MEKIKFKAVLKTMSYGNIFTDHHIEDIAFGAQSTITKKERMNLMSAFESSKQVWLTIEDVKSDEKQGIPLTNFYILMNDWLLPKGYTEIFSNHPNIPIREYHFIKDGVRVICVNDFEPYCYLHIDILTPPNYNALISSRHGLLFTDLEKEHKNISDRAKLLSAERQFCKECHVEVNHSCKKGDIVFHKSNPSQKMVITDIDEIGTINCRWISNSFTVNSGKFLRCELLCLINNYE